MNRRRAAFLVGLTLSIGILGLVLITTMTSKNQFSRQNTYTLYADVADASGIRGKTRVQVAGIDVGRITNIRHVRHPDGRIYARLTIQLLRSQKVYQNALLEKVSESLLGDFRLSLDPGSKDAPILQAEDRIIQVHGKTNLEDLQTQFVIIADHVEKISASLAHVIGSTHGEASLTHILDKVSDTVDNVHGITQGLEHLLIDNHRSIDTIITDVRNSVHAIAQIANPNGDIPFISHHIAALSSKLEVIADSLQVLIGQPSIHADSDNVNSPETTNGSVKQSLDSLTDSLKHIDNIAKKIDNGEGTIGKLINDPRIAEDIASTVEGANQVITGVTSVKTLIELRSEYDVPVHRGSQAISLSIKNTLGLRIFPKPDKFYIVEGIADPRGNQNSEIISKTLNNDPTEVIHKTVTSFNQLKFTAEFAKRYYFLTLRFGIIESTGGLGFDLHGFNNHMELRVDAFDFSRADPGDQHKVLPRLRMTGIVRVVDHLHLQGGMDDPLNNQLAAWFLGGVLRFTDDDLRTFLLLTPKL